MPQIYETINLYNLKNNIYPYRYIGSDQHDRDNYFGSNRELKEDIEKVGEEFFVKIPLKFFKNINNKDLRKKEARLLKENNVKHSKEFYNKSELYAPGGGVKGMKHKNKKIVSDAWKMSRKGWKPSKETKELWSNQRTGRLVSEETKEKMSIRSSGSNNSNALQWKIVTPNGQTVWVHGLRKWCLDNGHNYNRVYRQKDGFTLTKYGQGKGGPTSANK